MKRLRGPTESFPVRPAVTSPLVHSRFRERADRSAAECGLYFERAAQDGLILLRTNQIPKDLDRTYPRFHEKSELVLTDIFMDSDTAELIRENQNFQEANLPVELKF